MNASSVACPGLPSGTVFRNQDAVSGNWLWRAYVTYQGRRIDRCFYDGTYGGAALAEAEACAWQDAMMAAILEAPVCRAGGADYKNRLAAVNARFDAQRPRRVSLSVYLVTLRGEPCQLRALVSDRGQGLQRKELAANFRAVPMRTALDTLRQKVHQQIAAFFGDAVAEAFMAKHGRKFSVSQFDENGGLEIRERADLLLQAVAMTPLAGAAAIEATA